MASKPKKSGTGTGEPGGNLLVLGCSSTKRGDRARSPAIHLYDGVNFRVLRKTLRERGWPPGLMIKIVSAKYGLIDATEMIEPYDLRLDARSAADVNESTLARLRDVPTPCSVFVNLGKDYLPAVNGLESVFPKSELIFARGAIGMKMRALKQWLRRLPYGTATVRTRSTRKRSYLYFFPDWDDYIYEPFAADTATYTKGARIYAHEACGERVPFDGVLMSLSHLHAGKGALYRFANEGEGRINLRKRLRIPKSILLFGDCGAFSYAGKANPPFTPERAAQLYHKFGFDIGASVDHIPLPEIPVRRADGSVEKRPLAKSTRYRRMYLTRDNAERFLCLCKEKHYRFAPLGAVQGIDVRSYVARVHEYIDMGYEHIALGGLVPRADGDIMGILSAVRQAIQSRTRGLRRNLWLHLFGVLRPKLQPMFRELGVSSFDSASYFRKAWLRSDQNYLSADGHRWYGTMRVPMSTSKPMRQAAMLAGIEGTKLAEMERECLAAIDSYDGTPRANERVTESIDQYGPLLQRKGEDNHFADKHALLLADMPWKRCTCPFCRGVGIQVVVFRGASRNKRRGLHNTWVFYHKVLHGKAIPTSSVEKQ